jgi:hypothetical protein
LARKPDLMNEEQLVPGLVIGFADFTAPPPPTPLTAEITYPTVPDFFFNSLIRKNLEFTNSKAN